MTYRVLRIDEQLYGCEELPEGQPVCCDVLLEDETGERRVIAKCRLQVRHQLVAINDLVRRYGSVDLLDH